MHRGTVVLAGVMVAALAACSSGQAPGSGPAAATRAAVADSPARTCTKEIIAALALKWRQDQHPLPADDKKVLDAFLDANSVTDTAEYHIFMQHYTAQAGPIALAVVRGGDGEDAIAGALAQESSGVESDCAEAAG